MKNTLSFQFYFHYLHRYFRESVFSFFYCIGISIVFSFFLFTGVFAQSSSATLVFQSCENVVCTDIENGILEQKFEIGDQLPMRIVIKNPENAPVFSVQSWVKFNASVVGISGLSADESAFDLAAPGEFKAVNSDGELRIGRATTGSASKDSEIIVADFIVEIKKNPNLSTLQFLDFKKDAIGKTSIVTIQGNIPANILEENPKNLVFKNLKSAPLSVETVQNNTSVQGLGNGEVSVLSQNNTLSQNTAVDISAHNISISVEGTDETVTSLPQPSGFRTRTFSDGRVEMIWELDQDTAVKGYYLYYSNVSGTYMHRRDMGKTNVYTFDKDFFKQGKKVFFAVQAYSSNGTVSDFSNETFVITGEEGSASHPFFEQIFPDAEKIGEDIEKNKAYYVQAGESNENSGNAGGVSANFSTVQTAGNKNSVIVGNKTIESGSRYEVFLLLLGLVMIMGSGGFMLFARRER